MQLPNFIITDYGGNVLYAYNFEHFDNYLFMNMVNALESVYSEMFKDQLKNLQLNNVNIRSFELSTTKIYFCFDSQDEKYINEYMLNFISILNNEDLYSTVVDFPNPISHSLVQRFDEIFMKIATNVAYA